MPELPEVETIRRALAPKVQGRRLDALAILDPRWSLPLEPEVLSDACEGRVIERLDRRGKYLVFVLEDEVHLLLHLRMTGTLLYDAAPDQPYRRVTFGLSDAHELAFCDPRRFGTGELALGREALTAFFAPRLGVEPLDGGLTGAVLRKLAAGRRGPVKAFLLDQKQVAGVGNIYADEALHSAGVHPLRPAGSLKPAQYDRLAASVVDALEHGLARGGATIDDFRHPDGVMGAMQHDFKIHLRRGKPCLTCGTEVVKMVVGGRGTYVCERCQPRPRGIPRELVTR